VIVEAVAWPCAEPAVITTAPAPLPFVVTLGITKPAVSVQVMVFAVVIPSSQSDAPIVEVFVTIFGKNPTVAVPPTDPLPGAPPSVIKQFVPDVVQVRMCPLAGSAVGT
jgi:hypothetical protein